MGAVGGGVRAVAQSQNPHPQEAHSQQVEAEQSLLLTFVEVPEQEELAPTCSRASHMAEQIDTGVPEDTVETQHHLVAGRTRRILCQLCCHKSDSFQQPL